MSLHKSLPMLFTLSLLAMHNHAAEPTGPIHLSADKANLFEKTGTAIYQGNVVIEQDKLQIRADRVEVIHNAKTNIAEKVLANGKPATMEDERDPQQKLFARANTISYSMSDQLVVLTGSARLEQGQQIFEGEEIRYHLGEKRIEANASEQQRVKLVIPVEDTKSGQP